MRGLGKYIRLSDQDDDCRPGEKTESNSVANQRLLLDQFIANDPELAGRRALEFLDDGHTGTNFDRPGVQALFAAVRRGEIDCIIVKDLSRFGRDSLEVGEYLERVFPLLQVRFIAVNDGFDSRKKQYGTAGDLDIGVRNLINELYSRNVSVNVRTAKRQYTARGECIAAHPFYGYVKGAENRRQLEIDPPAADTVRMIFRLWLEGHSTADIAESLNARQVPSPSMRKRQLGAKRANWSKLREEVPWTASAIRIILQNERYTGKLISIRTMRKEIGKREQATVPKEDWIVVPDAFEAIISEDDFHRAQALFRTVPRTLATPVKKSNTQPLFSRKVFCGVCGLGLSRQKASRPYYRCNAPKGPLTERCKAIRISEEDLKAYVLEEIRNHAAAACVEKPADIAADAGAIQDRITALEQKIEKHWSAKKDAFVKRNGGLISQAEFDRISAERGRKIQQLRAELESLNHTVATARLPAPQNPDKLTDAAGAKELTREIMDELIRSIHVFEDGRIKTVWNTPEGVGKMVQAPFGKGEAE